MITKDIQQNHGSTLMRNNKNSHINLITSSYPNYQWLPWKFNQIPKGFWNDKNNVILYINWLGQKLKIKSMEDWYKVSYMVIHI